MLFALFSFIVSASAITSVCSSANSLLKIKDLVFSPDPPLANQNTTLYLKFDNPGPMIAGGTSTTAVTYNFIPFSPTVEPLCQNTACPVPTGLTEQSSSSLWPSGLSGTVVTTITWNDLQENELLCMKITVKV